MQGFPMRKMSLRMRALSAAAVILTPGVALALPGSQCGPLNTASDPQTATCTGAFNPYSNGIYYNDASAGTPGNMLINITGTAVVQPTSAGTAITAIGSNNFNSGVKLFSGSSVTGASGASWAVLAQTTGTGTASVDNFGTVSAGAIGLYGNNSASSNGAATLTNEVGGSVTTSGAWTQTGLLGYAATVTETNAGSLSLDSSSGGGQAYGFYAGSFSGTGSITQTNSGTLSVKTAGGAGYGLYTVASQGAVSQSNSGSLTVNTGAGAASGFYIRNSGAPGADTLSNTGQFNVTSSGGSATGMDAEMGTSAAFSSSQTAAGGGMTVSAAGGQANGFVANNVTGAVTVTTTGGDINVSNSAGTAYGVQIAGGSNVGVNFNDAKVGGTVYTSNLNVNATGGAANGVSIVNATGAVGVSASGANFTVTSANNAATGVNISGGTNVTLTTTPDVANSVGAALSVTGGGGVTVGVNITGVTGAVSNTIGDSFTVLNNAGAAQGLVVSNGTSVGASFANGFTVTAKGGNALGLNSINAKGAVSFTDAAGALVQATGGQATGVAISGGTADSVSFTKALVVTADTGVSTGVSITGAAGAMSANFTGALAVSSGSNSALGVSESGGTTLGATFGAPVSVTGANAGATTYGLQGQSFTGLATVSASDTFTVGDTAGSATGVSLDSGAGDTLSFTKAVSVNGAQNATGVTLTNVGGPVGATFSVALGVTAGSGAAMGVNVSGASGTTETFGFSGAVNVQGVTSAAGLSATGATGNVGSTFSDLLTVKATGGSATGVSASGSAGDTASFAKAVSVIGATSADGVILTGGSAAVSAAFSDVLGVTGQGAYATGLTLNGGTTETASFAKAVTVSGAGGVTYGAQLTGASGAVQLTASDLFTVSNSAGIAYGVNESGGAGSSLSFAKAVNVSATGNSATGVQTSVTSGANSALFSDTLTVTSNGGTGYGVFLIGGSTQTATTSKAVNVGSSTNAALGVLLDSSSATATANVNDALTVSGGNWATGVQINSGTGSTAATVNLAKGFTVTSGGPAFGVELFGDTTTALAVHTSGGSANVINVSSTGTNTVAGIESAKGVSFTLDGAPTINVSGKFQTYGVNVTNLNGPASLTLGAITAQSTTTGAQTAGVRVFTTGANGGIAITDVAAINVASGGVNYGVSAIANGSAGAINLNLNSVVLTGSATTGSGRGVRVQNNTTGTDATNITVQSVQTSGQNAYGVAAVTSTGGAGTLNLGSAGTGGVSTTGANSLGVNAGTTNGLLTINNNGLVSTQGANSIGIQGSSGGTGAVVINNTSTTTVGASSAGLAISTSTAAGTVNSTSVSTTGASSNAIQVATSTGAATVTALNTSATGLGSDAIHVTGSGAAADTVTVSDGGSASSTNGYGVYVSTGGTGTVNIGTAAHTASVSGGLWGVDVAARGAATVNVAGQVTGAGGAAIIAAGSTTTINNNGVVNGYVTLSGPTATVNNVGTWNAFGGDSAFGTGTTALNNSGTLNVYPAASVSTTLKFTGLGGFANSSQVSLAQGHTGDVLDIGGAAYVGSGGAKLTIDANLSASAVTGSAAQTADLLKATTGSVGGVTTLVVHDLGAGLPAAFNFTGIPVVTAGSSSAGAFVLQGGTIDKGFVQYELAQSGGTYSLVGLPSYGAFETTRVGAEAERYWRRTSDLWALQMREDGGLQKDGVSSWAQISAGSETEKSRPIFSVTAVQTFNFTPNLDIRDSYTGAEVGLDYGKGEWGAGVVAGFGSQDGRVKINHDSLNIDGYNLGAYARWRNSVGVFAQALAKYDSFSVKQTIQAGAVGLSHDGSTTGLELQAGYHWSHGRTFIEPTGSISWSASNLDPFTNAFAGASVNFHRAESAYGSLGLRFGHVAQHGDWTVRPYGGAYIEGEMGSRVTTQITAGATSLLFADQRPDAHGRYELGVTGRNKTGLELTAAVSGVAGGSDSGAQGRLGVSWHW